MPRNDVLEIQTGRGPFVIRVEGIEPRRVADVEQRIEPRKHAGGFRIVANDDVQVSVADFQRLARRIWRSRRRLGRGNSRRGAEQQDQQRWNRDDTHLIRPGSAWAARARGARSMAAEPVSPVRMRITSARGVTKILPSPIFPVRAAVTMVSIAV